MAETERGTRAGGSKPPHHATVVAWLALFIALGGVASGLPGRNSVTSNDLKTGAVRSPEIKTGQVKAPDIHSGAIRTSELLDGDIESEDLAVGAVDSPAIADGAVGPLDLGPVAAARVAEPEQAPGCASQVIESGPAEKLQFSLEEFDTQNLHAAPPGGCAVATQSRLTATIDGLYVVSAGVSWPANATNDRTLRLARTDTGGTVNIASETIQAITGSDTQQTVSTITDLDSGDFVEADVSQDSGSDLALTSVFDNHLSMSWIGPAP